ncbi:YciI family protein [Leeuwenhoekiella marinoflava]|uniref:YCII-related domain-containing protein n=2 Tax=Leeuwenhoekiella marinoflava TaxID=988 RepID=A0A4Q0PR55_9FLAO|nr:hypothetical protein [Leeuwenhoekiella marinoflava]RXG33076.1 putative protein YciI [Leeuwenhoekiella marinoflava]SHE37651.1 Uncharacterized conserved protein YciI, contains a putative active-site phosphohistidine [Leeuwenhoekiella marinoflava DSM 3653]
MERKLIFRLFSLLVIVVSCKEQPVKEVPVLRNESQNKKSIISDIEAELKEAGYLTMNYVDEKTKDTVIMQQYFMAFLKSGPNRDQSKAEADSLQKLHLEHLGRMYELGYADISGPFGDDGDIRGITIYNTPTLKMADSLANLDPMVQAGRLEIELHPWWAAKGFPLR